MKPTSNPFPPCRHPGWAILDYLEHELPGYRFETHIDMAFVIELLVDFPEMDILEEIKAFRWYHNNEPLSETAQRVSIRRWIARAARSRHLH